MLYLNTSCTTPIWLLTLYYSLFILTYILNFWWWWFLVDIDSLNGLYLLWPIRIPVLYDWLLWLYSYVLNTLSLDLILLPWPLTFYTLCLYYTVPYLPYVFVSSLLTLYLFGLVYLTYLSADFVYSWLLYLYLILVWYIWPGYCHGCDLVVTGLTWSLLMAAYVCIYFDGMIKL